MHSSKPDVITFSHFLPRKELPLPDVHEMAKASGCLKIEDQLRRAGSKLHIFGHTHINTQHELSGVTHVHTCRKNAMGYALRHRPRQPAPSCRWCTTRAASRSIWPDVVAGEAGRRRTIASASAERHLGGGAVLRARQREKRNSETEKTKPLRKM